MRCIKLGKRRIMGRGWELRSGTGRQGSELVGEDKLYYMYTRCLTVKSLENGEGTWEAEMR